MVILPEIGDTAFIPEIWALYALGITVLLLRFAIRIKTVGIKGFQGDDYFSILTLIFYTMDAVTVHIIFYAGTNVEAGVVKVTQTLTPQDIERFEFGSKLQLTAWYSYTALIWCMKASMLYFFNRLTIGLWQHKWIKWIGLVCAVSYLAVALTITFGCFPTHRNWQVLPDPGQKCTLKLQNFLVTVTLNVITDTLILAVPVPLLWGLRVPLRRKLVISILLCSGLFVIAAAIIRVALTLGSNPSATNINRWGVRETIVGIVTINAPILRPMFSRKFWSFRSWNDANLSHGESRNLEGGKSGATSAGKGFELSSKSRGHSRQKSSVWETVTAVDRGENGDREMKKQRRVSGSTIVSIRTGGSEEHIMQGSKRDSGSRQEMGMEVNVQTEFSVRTERIDGMEGGEEEQQREEQWQRQNMGIRAGITR